MQPDKEWLEKYGHKPFRKIGEVFPQELEDRKTIRARPIPGSGGPDPDIYTMKYMEGRTLKFKKGTHDPWNSWYSFGSEMKVREMFWYPNITKGDMIIDAGAGWGPYTLTAGLLGADVMAFEPDYRIFPDLETNVKLNKLEEEVELFTCGLSNEYKAGVDWDELKGIELMTLDEYELNKCDLMKIDVEGQELQVVEGARKTIAEYKPQLLIEVHFAFDQLMAVKLAEQVFKIVDGYKLITYDHVKDGATAHMYFWNETKS